MFRGATPSPPPIDVLIHTSQHFGVNQCSIGVCLILTSQDIENDNPGGGGGGGGGVDISWQLTHT